MGKHLLSITTFILFSIVGIHGQGVSINEVMPCNISTQINTDNYNFSGYIELFNGGEKSVNLKGMVLTHFKKKGNGEFELKWQWEIDSDLIVDELERYKLIWMDESDKIGHSPYKLDADGGYLTLYDGTTLIDSFAYERGDAHISYGRYNGSVGYMSPSPLSVNSMVVKNLTSNNRCTAPQFSQKPGVLTDSIYVSITTTTSNSSIYYTLDGSEPTDTSGNIYSEALYINKNTILRARSYKNGMLPSKITTGTYLFAEEARTECGGFSIPIVSLTTNDEYLNDPMIGILVTGKNGIMGEKDCNFQKANYNQDWKRAINFEYIVNNKQVLSQEVEAAVEGGCSRSNSIKSLSLKASKKTGKENFSYNIFNSKPDIFHRTLHLRNGGQGFDRVRFGDGLMQTFAIGLNIDYQAYQPVAYYLNGEYMGLMGLRERTNADYVKSNYGYDDDEIDLVTLSDQLKISANKGTLDAYNALVEYLSTNDPEDENYYKGAARLMDMDEYIDYQILQQFIANVDWPGNNTKMWRLKDNGRFRWIMFDTDFGFGLQGESASKNMIEWCQAIGSKNWGNDEEWMTIIFANLSKNSEFKQRFVTKYLDRLNTTFSETRINAVFDSICTILDKENCLSKNKSAFDEAASMRRFALQRPSYVYNHLVGYVGGDSIVDLEITSNVDGAVLMMNGEKSGGYNGKYISGMTLNLKPYAPAGYRFSEWKVTPEATILDGTLYWESIMTKQTQWKYYYDKQAPDSAWFDTLYDDSQWESGAGRFGYSSSGFMNPSQNFDVKLDYGTNRRNKYMTAYFRSSFSIDNLKDLMAIQASISYDDGYVLYINGVEVEQTNMKKVDSVQYSTEAASNVNTATRTLNINPDLLVEGKNFIAVEMHLNKASSDNLTFELEMKAQKIQHVENPDKEQLNIWVKSDQKIEAIFEKIENPMPLTLQLNEVCASSNKNSGNSDDYGDYPDWIEIYNYGTEPQDLAGLYLSDEKNNWTKFQIPYGSSETLIQPKERKILWAKGDLQYDPLYLDFKLSADKATPILLTQKVGGEVVLIDYLQIYENHPTNGSYGRVTDGAEDWIVFDTCSTQGSLATPNLSNGSISCEEETFVNPLYDETFSLLCFPNPASTEIHIHAEEEIEDLLLYDISGVLVYQTTPTTNQYTLDVSELKNGIYILHAETKSGVYRNKIIKE